MSKITKSPGKVARAAYKIAKSTLPQYAHQFSPKKFTQPQLFVCLVLKIFFKTDYRGITAILADSGDLRKCFNLKTVPHFTTLQKASKHLLCSKVAEKLLLGTISGLLKKGKVEFAKFVCYNVLYVSFSRVHSQISFR